MLPTKNILLNGVNGSGKTDHGRILAALLRRQYVDMSRILKLGMRFWPEFDSLVAPPMAGGELVPDELLLRPLLPYFETLQPAATIVCAGVPRIETQVQPFFEVVEKTIGVSAFIVVDLVLSPEMAVQRCRKRAEDDRRAGRTPRADDLDETIIRKRIAKFEKNKVSLLDALTRQSAEIVTVECHDDPQRTFSRIARAVGANDYFFVKPATP
jgi:adenylate kinase family enzyme